MRIRRAIVLRCLAYALIGAAINVSVAWLCAATADFRDSPEQFMITHDGLVPVWESVAQRSAFGVTQAITRYMQPSAYGVGGDAYFLEFPHDLDAMVYLRPGQSIEEARPDIMQQVHKGATESLIALTPWQNSAGWPMRSMACWLENLTGYPSNNVMATRGTVTLVSGIDLRRAPLGPAARVLPLQPLWTGFIVNTVFYALALFVVVRGAFALRARHRLRRGRCPRCAYPIGSSPVCTECGAALPAIERRMPASEPRMPFAAL